jgi:hypothetical protein
MADPSAGRRFQFESSLPNHSPFGSGEGVVTMVAGTEPRGSSYIQRGRHVALEHRPDVSRSERGAAMFWTKCCAMAEGIRFEQLVAELRRSPSDLARLVTQVYVRQPSRVWMSAKSAEAWQQRHPEAWTKVLAWLKQQGVFVETV